MKFNLLVLIIAIAISFGSCNSSKSSSNNNNEDTVNVKNNIESVTTENVNPLSDKWEEYKSEEGNFSVLFPQKPQLDKQSTPTAVGDIVLNMYMVEMGDVVYFVMISDMPEKIIEGNDPKKLLEGGRDGALQQLQNSNLIKQEEIEIDGHTGIQIEAEGVTEGIEVYLKGNYYLVKNRLYQVYVMAKKGAYSSDDINKFLESFKLI